MNSYELFNAFHKPSPCPQVFRKCVASLRTLNVITCFETLFAQLSCISLTFTGLTGFSKIAAASQMLIQNLCWSSGIKTDKLASHSFTIWMANDGSQIQILELDRACLQQSYCERCGACFLSAGDNNMILDNQRKVTPNRTKLFPIWVISRRVARTQPGRFLVQCTEWVLNGSLSHFMCIQFDHVIASCLTFDVALDTWWPATITTPILRPTIELG